MTGDLAVLLSRQAIGEETILGKAEDAPVSCESGNEYDGRIGLRVSAVFVILIGSSLGMQDARVLPNQSFGTDEAIRRVVSGVRRSPQEHRCTQLGFLHSQIFRFWCHCCHSLHSRKLKSIAHGQVACSCLHKH